MPDTKDVYTHTFILHICKSSLRNAEDMRFAFKLQLSKFTKRASPLLTPSFSLSCRLLPIRRQETDVTMEVGWRWVAFFSPKRALCPTQAPHGARTGEEGGTHPVSDVAVRADDEGPEGRSPPGRAQLPAMIPHGQDGSVGVVGLFTAHSLSP